MDAITYNVGDALRARRESLGMTQMAVVERTSLSHPNALGRLERGNELSSSLTRLHEVAGALGWSIEELLAAARGGS